MESIIGYMFLGGWLLFLLIVTGCIIFESEDDSEIIFRFVYLAALVITIIATTIHFNGL